MSRFLVPAGPCLRLDAFLVGRVPGLSRRGARELLEQDRVQVNGRSARKGEEVRPLDCVTVDCSPRSLAAEEDPHLCVLLEDAQVLAVDKPSGLPSVALRPEDRGTLANLLIGRYPELTRIGRPLECGAVHRLDNGTSGVMLVARTQSAYRHLRRQFRERAVAKQYLALVEGNLSGSGRVSLPIAHHPYARRRMVVCSTDEEARRLGARPASTRYRALVFYPHASLVVISIATGARHQIRVHMAALGHPVVGDPLYGSGNSPRAERLMLHASRIRFRHPSGGPAVLVRAPLPAEFRAGLPTHPMPGGAA